MSNEQSTTPLVEVKQTIYGVDTVVDTANLISNYNLPAFKIQPYRSMDTAELEKKFPYAMQYLKNLNVLAQYVKTLGGDSQPISYMYRAQHLDGMKRYLMMSIKLNFIKNLDTTIKQYINKNVGWGLFRIEPVWEKVNNRTVMSSVELFIGDEKLNLNDKRINISGIGWDGRILSAIYICDANVNKTRARFDEEMSSIVKDDLPYNVTIRVDESSAGSGRFAEFQYRIGREQVEMESAVQFSPFDFMLMRVTDLQKDIENNIYLGEYETPLFLGSYDYHPDISFFEFDDCCDKVQKAKDKELFFNAREFAANNLFRWGIASPELWKKTKEVFDKVYDPDCNKDEDNRYDHAVISWAQAQPNFKSTSFEAGSVIAQMVSSKSLGLYELDVLLVARELDDAGFLKLLPRRIILTNYNNIVRSTRTCSRLNYTPLKAIVLNDDGEFDYVVDASEIFIVDRSSLVYTNVRLFAEGSFGTAGEDVKEDKSIGIRHTAVKDFIAKN